MSVNQVFGNNKEANKKAQESTTTYKTYQVDGQVNIQNAQQNQTIQQQLGAALIDKVRPSQSVYVRQAAPGLSILEQQQILVNQAPISVRKSYAFENKQSAAGGLQMVPKQGAIVLSSPVAQMVQGQVLQGQLVQGQVMQGQMVQGQLIQTVSQPVTTVVYEQKPTVIYEAVSPTPRNLVIQSPPKNDQSQLLRAEIEKLTFVINEKTQENQSWQAKCSHLEAHLKQVNQHQLTITELETKIQFLLAENQKLNVLIIEKEREIEMYRLKFQQVEVTITETRTFETRYRELESRFQLMIRELEQWREKYYELERDRHAAENVKRSANQDRDLLESELRKMKELLELRTREIEEWRIRCSAAEAKLRDTSRIKELENRLVLLAAEIERLHLILKEKLEELEGWRGKYHRLELTITEYQGRDSKLLEYENRIALLTQEIERLNIFMRQRTEEIEGWKLKYSKLEIQVRDVGVYDSEIARLKDLINLRNQEIDDWRTKYSRLEITVNEFRTKETRLVEYENRIAMLTTEIERLNAILRQRMEDIEGWKMRYSKLEVSVREQGGFEVELKRLRDLIELRNKEIEEWKTRYSRLEISFTELRGNQSKFVEYENRIAMLATEVERLTGLLRSRGEEIDTWKSRYSSLEISITELKNNKGVIVEYENKIALIAQENERLNIRLRERLEEYEALRVKYTSLEAALKEKGGWEVEVRRLREILEVRTREIDEWKNRYSRLELSLNEYKGGEARIREYENKIVLLTTELDRMNMVLKQRMEEIQILRERYQKLEFEMSDYKSSYEKVRVLSNEIDRLNSVIEDNKREIEQWRFKYVDYTSLTKRIQEHLVVFVLLMTEIESLRRRVSEKESEVEEVRRASLAPYRDSYFKN